MKKIIIAIGFSLIGYLGTAQITLQPLLPQVGFFQKSQLWNVLAINNSGSMQECYLQLSLQDRRTGLEIMSATTSSFTLPAGTKQLTEANLNPIQYSYFSSGNISGQFLPIGSYMACFKLMGSGHLSGELNEACAPFDVAPLSPPMLIMPSDSSVLKVQPGQFSWVPPSPFTMFQQLHYELVIAEILSGQQPQEAVELNAPFYMDLNVPTNSMNYTGAYPSFEQGKWYAWQIIAQDGENYAAKTDVFDFKIDTNSVQLKPSTEMPFITLKRNLEAGAAICKGDLRVEYDNELNDKTIDYKIIALDNANNNIAQSGKLQLKPGKNFIDISLKNHFEINKIYLFQLINSRSEYWNAKFLHSK
ncbi:MAG TPA: hypothetical protein VK559_04205 [Ferruginibacter sp.]|nr:hypothetical protein [Ferruginibacter sp.]